MNFVKFNGFTLSVYYSSDKLRNYERGMRKREIENHANSDQKSDMSLRLP